MDSSTFAYFAYVGSKWTPVLLLTLPRGVQMDPSTFAHFAHLGKRTPVHLHTCTWGPKGPQYICTLCPRGVQKDLSTFAHFAHVEFKWTPVHLHTLPTWGPKGPQYICSLCPRGVQMDPNTVCYIFTQFLIENSNMLS